MAGDVDLAGPRARRVRQVDDRERILVLLTREADIGAAGDPQTARHSSW